ncbi:Crp/Fnr family transcriptional regulator [Streptomyces sp. NPDC059639]|uniref:Crp/Fnr family transcriptional regulator n=1 Tax=Streptomyces sp. NPDC059639 TaxID=3346891 RepID=UPI003688A6AD
MSEGGSLSVAPFRALLSSEQWEVLKSYPSRPHPAGDILLRQGEDGRHVLALIDGLVKIIRHDRDGRRRLLAFRGEGEILGEMALRPGGARLAEVRTMSACRVTTICADEFRRFVSDHQLAILIAEMAFNRLQEQTEAHDGAVHERLAKALVRLVEVSGGQASFSLTREELAQHIGVGRKSVSKALEQLGPGLVQAGKSRIGVISLDGLREIATHCVGQ